MRVRFRFADCGSPPLRDPMAHPRTDAQPFAVPPHDARSLARQWLRELASPEVFGVLAERHRRGVAEGSRELLAPCPDVDGALQRLVAVVAGADDGPDEARWRPWAEPLACAVLDDDEGWRARAGQFRDITAIAETQLELHYARHIRTLAMRRGPGGPSRLIRHFPYLSNYVDLVRAELAARNVSRN